MKLRFSFFLAFSVMVFFACHDKEEIYPIEPHIEFEDVKFVDTPAGTINDFGEEVPDSLKLTFNFTDGDADFGFLNDEYKFPYQEKSYFLRSNGSLVPNEKLEEGDVRATDLLRYHDRLTSPYDTLPPFEKPFYCLNWETIYKTTNNMTTVVDTLYYQRNPNHYNLSIDFLVQQNDGSFLKFDFEKELCATFNTRCPASSSNGPVFVKLFSSKRGIVTYSMAGSGFKFVFGNKPMKLRFFIRDRALHQSNSIETSVFTIPGS